MANQKPEVGSQRPEAGNQTSGLRPLTSVIYSSTLNSQTLSTTAPPPPTNGFFLHFTYPMWPLTNGYLLHSTDLVHWSKCNDYWLTTNSDQSVEWNIHFDPARPAEFFRAGGETIGE
jgi:hypothetical protein